jgi:formate-dependent phosphoribosylglycinamide formyltransferase (GAR transformylase)
MKVNCQLSTVNLQFTVHSSQFTVNRMPRVLLLATTTGYQTRAFGEAAERLGVELVFATDRCHVLEDPWQDEAIPIRFYDEDSSVAAIVEASRTRPIDGLLVVGDRPTVIAARAAHALGLPGHPPAAAGTARHKQRTRERLREAGLPVPWFVPATVASDPAALARSVSFPCVLKPVALSGSRGVMRADDPASFVTAFERLQALLRSPDVRAERSEAHDAVLVEAFIPGREYAVEALLDRGHLHLFAVFDKPDPLDGPFFEETIYVTPSIASADVQRAIIGGVRRAAAAIGLHHGPIHAECRVNADGVFVLEVAARPIGGLCARVFAFRHPSPVPVLYGGRVPVPVPYGGRVSLEELLLRQALGESPDGWQREPGAAGVMMIPIPRRGILRGVDGVDDARAAPNVDDVRITARMEQLLVPLPEGASYLGFIFARADEPADVERALREAHSRLTFAIDPEFPVLTAAAIRYNHGHGC